MSNGSVIEKNYKSKWKISVLFSEENYLEKLSVVMSITHRVL